MVVLMVLLMTGALMLLVLGLRDMAAGPIAQRQAVSSVLDDGGATGQDRLARLDRAFASTRVGGRLLRELQLAGSGRSPLSVAATGLGFACALGAGLWVLLAPALGVLGLLLGGLGLRAWLRREQDRRREAFLAQMPELARVLANATQAGLSIRTAIALAAEELDQPAATELRLVSTSLTFGNDIDTALTEVTERLPSREVAVLMSTLVVSAHAGGSLVTSLRTIADTLEQRRETRREVKSVLAESVATGYTVIGLGIAILLLLNLLNPGTVETMTRHPAGQVALVFAGVMFTAGFVLIRRLTRVEL